MAKIVSSEAAPAEVVHYTFADVEFDLSGKKSFETDDPSVLADAEAHPWLTVKYPEVAVVAGDFHDQLAPQDDPFTAQGNKVDYNNPEVAAAAEAAKADRDVQPVALDAGAVQTEVVEESGVAETLAADSTSKTAAKTNTEKDS